MTAAAETKRTVKILITVRNLLLANSVQFEAQFKGHIANFYLTMNF